MKNLIQYHKEGKLTDEEFVRLGNESLKRSADKLLLKAKVLKQIVDMDLGEWLGIKMVEKKYHYNPDPTDFNN